MVRVRRRLQHHHHYDAHTCIILFYCTRARAHTPRTKLVSNKIRVFTADRAGNKLFTFARRYGTVVIGAAMYNTTDRDAPHSLHIFSPPFPSVTIPYGFGESNNDVVKTRRFSTNPLCSLSTQRNVGRRDITVSEKYVFGKIVNELVQ